VTSILVVLLRVFKGSC